MGDESPFEGWQDDSNIVSGISRASLVTSKTSLSGDDPEEDIASPRDTDDLDESSSSETESETETASPPQEEQYFPEDHECLDCNQKHLPRRLVICIDELSKNSKGQDGNSTGGATNLFRIWQLIPQQETVRDAVGRKWDQRCYDYIQIVWTPDNESQGTYAVRNRLSKSATDVMIKDIYHVINTLINVRLIVGMLHQIGALLPSLDDYDMNFMRLLRLYRTANGIGEFRLYIDSQLRWRQQQRIRKSCPVRFLGAFDNFAGGRNGLLGNVVHIRHALALFERRKVFALERFSQPEAVEQDGDIRSFQEAWFAGTHSDLGGGCEEDGLALWPIQWILSEAQRYGLVLKFTKGKPHSTQNPYELVFPGGSTAQVTLHCMNGISVRMNDLTDVFRREGFHTSISTGKLPHVALEDRHVFQAGRLIGQISSSKAAGGTFVHPSLFFMDHKIAEMIHVINLFPDVQLLRGEELFIQQGDRIFWKINKEIQLNREAERPRILVCGQTGAGKSALINKVFGQEKTKEEHGLSAGDHDVNMGYEVPGKPYILHDSKGFESGDKTNFQEVQDFISERRRQHIFQNQLHCVWYCTSTDNPRMQPSDKQFLRLKFGGVPVILVFTKLDRLRSDAKNKVLSKYLRLHRDLPRVEHVSQLAEPARSQIEEEGNQALQSVKLSREGGWKKKAPIEVSALFVTTEPFGHDEEQSIPELQRASQTAMTGPRMRQIHAEAQEAYITEKLKSSVSKTVELFFKGRPIMNSANSEELRQNTRKTVVENIIKIFNYQGHESCPTSHIIQELLYPTQKTASNWSTIFRGIPGLAALAGFAKNVGITTTATVVGTVAVGVVGAMANLLSSIALSEVMIHDCLDALFVLERVYWYDGEEINPQFVKAACLDHLKCRPEIYKRVRVELDQKLHEPEHVLSKCEDIVEEFRSRKLSTEEDPRDGSL